MPMSSDSELEAIQKLISALEPLNDDARRRVIQYVFGRLGLDEPVPNAAARTTPPTPVILSSEATATPEAPRHLSDIRTFAGQKSPRSVSERIAIVAYYLQELAPAAERSSEITAADVGKYFKQAGFPLPALARKALFDAKNAGYLDSTSRGKFSLNPVGHNLVVHGLPGSGTTESTRVPRPRRTAQKKRSKRSPKVEGGRKKVVPKKPGGTQ